MEILTTTLLIIASFSFSIFLVAKGISGSKKNMDELKSRNN
jgi:hypothetical protein